MAGCKVSHQEPCPVFGPRCLVPPRHKSWLRHFRVETVLVFCWYFQHVSVDGSTESCKSRDEESSISQLLTHGVSSQQFTDMALPSFRPTYLFLARIPLDIIHECLKLRLEQRRPDRDPSLLSLQSVSHASCLILVDLSAISRTWWWW